MNATFSTVTALRELGAGRFAADVHPEWSIGGKPNGGYLLAMLARAATSVSTHRHPIAASAHFLRSPEPGPVIVEAEVLREGRSASQLRVSLRQHGWGGQHGEGGQDELVCIESLMTTSDLDPDAKPYWSDGVPEHGTATFAGSVRLPPVTPTGLPVPIMGHVDVRLEPDSLGFASGRPSGRGELRGWLALPHGEDFDAVSLLYAVDALPPATLDVELTGWVPTLELTVYVRSLPAPGPVRVLHRTHLIDGQRADETCWVWDSTGRLVASSSQLAGIRLG